MSKTFKLDDVEYCIVRNPYTNGPMIARVDGLPIENKKKFVDVSLDFMVGLMK